MSDLARLLQREQRRHFLISFGLISAAIVSATMVTNERGVFSALGGGSALTALERAFTAITDNGPTPLLFRRNSSRGPFGQSSNPPGSPDLSRRLADALGDNPAADNPLPNIVTQDITPDQLALNDVPGTLVTDGDAPGSPTNPANPAGPGAAQTVQPLNDADTPPVAPVPEPAVWALMIGGFGMIGWLQRSAGASRRRRAFLNGE